MACSKEDAVNRLFGSAQAKADENFRNVTSPGDTEGAIHQEKGAAIQISSRAYKKTFNNLNEAITQGNPIVLRLTEKLGEGAHGLALSIFSPKDTVASPIFQEIRNLHDDVLNRDEYDKELSGSGINKQRIWREEIAPHAAMLKQAIEADPEAHGIDKVNLLPTQKFLAEVENGWPYWDFQGQEALEQKLQRWKDKRPTFGDRIDKVTSALMYSRVMLSPVVAIFHVAELPVRFTAEYPQHTIPLLPHLLTHPQEMFGSYIKEADETGFYNQGTSSFHSPLPRPGEAWTPEQRAAALTGIPFMQRGAQNAAYRLFERGVPMAEAMDRVALQSVSPFEKSWIFTQPDPSGSMSYIRYSMLNNAYYLNMIKNTLNVSNPRLAAKSFGSLAIYSGLKAYAFGASAAIPTLGLMKLLNPDLEDQLDAFDNDHDLNQFYKMTGFDIGPGLSPLPGYGMPAYKYKLLFDAIKDNSEDVSHIIKAIHEGNGTEAGLDFLHAALLDTAAAGVRIPGTEVPIPNSVIKLIGASAKSVNDAAGNPFPDIDWDTFGEKALTSYGGKSLAQKFKDHATETTQAEEKLQPYETVPESPDPYVPQKEEE